ncbi:enoyl-CoA hydratase-related protein [[Mycobacterium] crassicus]|uniref:enoyl-CoA hydratase-related protein n=1 Tax=[Mycobacterium] crassicus TaxID=2872309 RepID=UPI001CDAD1E5
MCQTLLADITIAARPAYFLVPQVTTLGIAPDARTTWIPARHVGRARALGMCLTGARIGAEEAERSPRGVRRLRLQRLDDQPGCRASPT